MVGWIETLHNINTCTPILAINKQLHSEPDTVREHRNTGIFGKDTNKGIFKQGIQGTDAELIEQAIHVQALVDEPLPYHISFDLLTPV